MVWGQLYSKSPGALEGLARITSRAETNLDYSNRYAYANGGERRNGTRSPRICSAPTLPLAAGGSQTGGGPANSTTGSQKGPIRSPRPETITRYGSTSSFECCATRLFPLGLLHDAVGCFRSRGGGSSLPHRQKWVVTTSGGRAAFSTTVVLRITWKFIICQPSGADFTTESQ